MRNLGGGGVPHLPSQVGKLAWAGHRMEEESVGAVNRFTMKDATQVGNSPTGEVWKTRHVCGVRGVHALSGCPACGPSKRSPSRKVLESHCGTAVKDLSLQRPSSLQRPGWG